MALLQQSGVVFYHGLNDLREYTQQDIWAGESNFVPSIQQSGLLANTFKTEGQFSTIDPSGGYNILAGLYGNCISFINPSAVVAIFNSGTNTMLIDGSISGLNVTWNRNSCRTLELTPRGSFTICPLDDKKFAIGYSAPGPATRFRGVTLDGSGGPLLVGASVDIGQYGKGRIVSSIDSNRFLVCCKPDDFDQGNWFVIACRLNGSGASMTTTSGAFVPVSSGAAVVGSRGPTAFTFLSVNPDTTYSGVLVWQEKGNSGRITGTFLSISGVTITKLGSTRLLTDAYAVFSGDDNFGYMDCINLDDRKVALMYAGNRSFTDPPKNRMKIINITSSGTIATSTSFRDSPNGDNGFSMGKLGGPKEYNHNFMMFSVSGDLNQIGQIANVDTGNDFASISAPFVITSGAFTASSQNKNSLVSKYNLTNKVLLTWNQQTAISGIPGGLITKMIKFPLGRSDIGSLYDIYPNISGSTSLTVGFWANLLNTSNSSLAIKKGVEIVVSSGYLGLQNLNNGNAVFWNVSLSGLAGSIDDHLYFLHFAESGANWNLFTSINGSGWINRGAQASGTFDRIYRNGQPEIEFNSNILVVNSIWLDEVVMYKNTDMFTNEQLLKLYRLAPVLNQPFSSYSFVPEGTPSGMHNMFLYGHANASGTLNMYMSGIVTPTPTPNPSGDQFSWSIEHFLYLFNFKPQLVGNLGYSGVLNDVTIKIWQLKDGVPEEVPLPTSGCYPIGNTGRWGYSTENLPITDYIQPQYHYVMLAPNDNIVQGHFLFDMTQKLPRDTSTVLRNTR